jgi:hypothetical protein
LLAADLRRRHPGFLFPDQLDDLIFVERFFLVSSAPSRLGRHEFRAKDSTGLRSPNIEDRRLVLGRTGGRLI